MAINLIQRWRYSPWYAQLVVIRKCNLSCGYCNEFDKTSDPIPLETLKSRAKKLKGLGTFAINMSGGEPTMNPRLADFIEYCRFDLKFLRTSIITNGFFLKKELIEDFNRAGLQGLQISIDGVKTNGTTVKVLDSLRKRLQLLKDYARFPVVVSGVIGACPPEETFEVIHYAAEMGFRPRVMFLHDRDGQLNLTQEQIQVFERIKGLVPRTFPEFTNHHQTMIKNGSAPFKCRAGSRYLYVDEEGMVSWCSQTRHLFRKNLMDYTYEDLKREFHSYKSCQDKCTIGCVRAASSVDGWRYQKGSGTEPSFESAPAFDSEAAFEPAKASNE
jgi:MoaA/NifB/PqqE/SkfB family radical SAM enzyme